MKKKRILTLIDYYLPGYKAGGPIRTMANLADQLSDEYEFWIVTRDRDLGDRDAYDGVELAVWTEYGNAKIFYIPKLQWGPRIMHHLLVSTQYDILYLNSFFSPMVTGFPLLLRLFKVTKPVPVVLAPRGQLTSGALNLKSTKKRFYIALVKKLGLYNDLLWQASSKREENDIRRLNLDCNDSIYIAPDLLSKVESTVAGAALVQRPLGPVRLVFISRISPIKNLDFLLRVLNRVACMVELSVYGPKEDLKYWEVCQRMIESLPSNIKVSVGGHIPYEHVQSVFSQQDLFVFPTQGENFGHVIFEAMSVGTSVLVSDQTPWRADPRGAVQVLPLEEQKWCTAIECWGYMEPEQFLERRRAAFVYAQEYLDESQSIEKSKLLFSSSLNLDKLS